MSRPLVVSYGAGEWRHREGDEVPCAGAKNPLLRILRQQFAPSSRASARARHTGRRRGLWGVPAPTLRGNTSGAAVTPTWRRGGAHYRCPTGVRSVPWRVRRWAAPRQLGRESESIDSGGSLRHGARRRASLAARVLRLVVVARMRDESSRVGLQPRGLAQRRCHVGSCGAGASRPRCPPKNLQGANRARRPASSRPG
jgi:hypothetical protein